MAVSFGVEEEEVNPNEEEEDFERKLEERFEVVVKFTFVGFDVEIFNFAFVAAFRGFLISLKIGLSESEELFQFKFFFFLDLLYYMIYYMICYYMIYHMICNDMICYII